MFVFKESGRGQPENMMKSLSLAFAVRPSFPYGNNCLINPKTLLYEMVVANPCEECYSNWLLPGKLRSFYFTGITIVDNT